MKTKDLLAFTAGLVTGFLGSRHLEKDTIDGRSVIITGASKGLGFVLARDFARRGAKVAICARNADELARARRRIADEGGVVFARVCDVSSEEQVDQFIDEVRRHHGRIDILVNNAGVIQVGALEDLERSDFELAMDVIFWGMLHTTRAVLPKMLDRGDGRIVNITSIGGKVSVPHLLPYCSAKFAAVGLSEGLGAELAGTGIDVITIAPGLMRTGSPINALFKGKQEEEFTWFSLGDSLPVISMDVERASRRIIRATEKRRSERVLSVPAKLLATLHGLFPGLTARILGAANQLLLPAPEGAKRDAQSGDQIYGRLEPDSKSLLDTLTLLGRRAARRFQPETRWS